MLKANGPGKENSIPTCVSSIIKKKRDERKETTIDMSEGRGPDGMERYTMQYQLIRYEMGSV